jgi:heme exporter protein C
MTAERLLGPAAAVVMLAALYLIFCVAPTEATMGDVQRIFYFHVPCWWVTYGGFFTVAIAGAI